MIKVENAELSNSCISVSTLCHKFCIISTSAFQHVFMSRSIYSLPPLQLMAAVLKCHLWPWRTFAKSKKIRRTLLTSLEESRGGSEHDKLFGLEI